MTLSPLIDVQLVEGPVGTRDVRPWPEDAGAECVFLGRTRAEHHEAHGALELLRYEAYHDMAIDRLRGLASSAMSRFGLLAVRIHHAIGDVRIGEASVLVQVAAGHRAPAFDGCRFLIDALKIDVPIWKQEVWSDGTTWSDGAAVPTPEANA